MSDAREEILQRVRNALTNVPSEEKPGDVTVPRAYCRKGALSKEERVDLFARRVGEYKATVQRIGREEVQDAVSRACRVQGVRQLVVPPGFPEQWLTDSIEPLYDRPEAPLSPGELDVSDGVITTCGLGVAQTGTIILNAGRGQGRRALTLLPDYHLCLVLEDQIVELLPEGFAHFDHQVTTEGAPITLISGPSATSDIELSRVEGVHGPRRLEVFIVRE